MVFRRLGTADGIHNYFWKAQARSDELSMGIKDKVAIVAMGCTAFGERWDQGFDDLAREAVAQATAPAGAPRASPTSTPSGSGPPSRR